MLDLSRPVYSTSELITDSFILIVFLSLLIIAQRKLTFKKVHPLFGIFVVLLLGINFIQFGGVEGTNCFNYYTGIYVVVMLFSGWRLYGLISFQLTLLLLLIFFVFINHPLYQFFLISIDTRSSTEFIFSLISIAVFTFYLKRLTVSEISKLESKISEVRKKVKESKKLNQELLTQSNELKEVQNSLQQEVHHRVSALEIQNEAIDQYIHFNTSALKDPFIRLSAAVNQFKTNAPLYTLLKLSSVELDEVITTINQTLQSEQKLNRSTLDKNLQ